MSDIDYAEHWHNDWLKINRDLLSTLRELRPNNFGLNITVTDGMYITWISPDEVKWKIECFIVNNKYFILSLCTSDDEEYCTARIDDVNFSRGAISTISNYINEYLKNLPHGQ